MQIIQLTNITYKQTMGYVFKAKTGEVLVVDGGHTGHHRELERILNRARSRGCLASLDDMIDFFRDPRRDTSEIFARIYKLAEAGHITAQDFADVRAGSTITIGGKVSSIK